MQTEFEARILEVDKKLLEEKLILLGAEKKLISIINVEFIILIQQLTING